MSAAFLGASAAGAAGLWVWSKIRGERTRAGSDSSTSSAGSYYDGTSAGPTSPGLSYTDQSKGYGYGATVSDAELRKKLGDDWQFAYDDRKIEGKWLGGKWSASPITEQERGFMLEQQQQRGRSGSSFGGTEIVEPKVESHVTKKGTVETRIY